MFSLNETGIEQVFFLETRPLGQNNSNLIVLLIK